VQPPPSTHPKHVLRSTAFVASLRDTFRSDRARVFSWERGGGRATVIRR
jgi:hypothetical protein